MAMTANVTGSVLLKINIKIKTGPDYRKNYTTQGYDQHDYTIVRAM